MKIRDFTIINETKLIRVMRSLVRRCGRDESLRQLATQEISSACPRVRLRCVTRIVEFSQTLDHVAARRLDGAPPFIKQVGRASARRGRPSPALPPPLPAKILAVATGIGRDIGGGRRYQQAGDISRLAATVDASIRPMPGLG
jgi:hypothetical protein